MKSEEKDDWYDNLSEEQQQDINEGIEQADKGEFIPHEDVVELFKKWGLK